MIDKKGEIIRRSYMNQGYDDPIVHSNDAIVTEDGNEDGINPLT